MRKMLQGIIFDMDNTILRSRIDYASMKLETYEFLVSEGVLPPGLQLTAYTTSTIIEKAMLTGAVTYELKQRMWEIPRKYEMMGMQDADLEPGVTDLLNELRGNYCMTVVTNNAVDAAIKALRDNRIADFFECIVGREMMSSLKPAPDGYLYVLEKYDHIPREAWIAIGDSWIDGKAAAEAGIDFIGYQADAGNMRRMGAAPRDVISDIRDLKRFLN